jgi:dihydrofolate synthase/folylpolyglutamate synthase
MPLYGEHQTENAALAVAAVEAFLGNGERRILDDIVRVSFADIASPGRLQVVSREPLTIVDGAHNPHGVRSLAKALKSSFGSPRTVGVVGVLNGKNVDEMLEILAGSFERVIVTASKSDRSVEKEELATIAARYWGEENISVASSVTKAMQDARELVAELDLEAIVITGSLSVVGEALVTVQEENNED